MKSKKILGVFAIAIIVTLVTVKGSSVTHAQQPTFTNNGDIPSDLSLDLNLAQQNPDPDQQSIVSSETKQAESVTATGDTTTVQPQDTVIPQVKTESVADAIHPEQTTSEQVITTPVVIDVPVNPSGNIQNQSQDQNQPTGIQSPNNNTNNGTVNQQDNTTGIPANPNDTTTPTVDQGQPVLTPSDNSNNGASAPTGINDNVVPGTTVPAPNDNAAPADNSTNSNLPAPTAEDSGSTTSIPSEQQPVNNDNNGVQGASTGPTNIFQKILNFFFGRK